MSIAWRCLAVALAGGLALLQVSCVMDDHQPSPSATTQPAPTLTPSEPALSVEVGDGITFLRTRLTLNDAVAHRGEMFVGSDSCLYVRTEGRVFLAAVGSDDQVSREGVTSRGLQFPLEQEVIFGGLATGGEVPESMRALCVESTETFGLGF